jgi:hypothetical protein
MATPDHDSAIRDFKKWIEESTCYSVANLNSDEQRQFVPSRAVEAHFEENQNAQLNNILTELYQPKEPPTYAEAILKRYTAVFCILLGINRGNLIHLFTQHDALRDAYLPFHPDTPPSDFPQEESITYQAFCQNQWKYSVPVLNRYLNQAFLPEQILPIVSREVLSKRAHADIWKINIHKDYNHLQTQDINSVGAAPTLSV